MKVLYEEQVRKAGCEVCRDRKVVVAQVSLGTKVFYLVTKMQWWHPSWYEEPWVESHLYDTDLESVLNEAKGWLMEC